MLKMVRFGVVESMNREVQGISLQTLLKKQNPTQEHHSAETKTLLEEVCPMSLVYTNSFHFRIFSFCREINCQRRLKLCRSPARIQIMFQPTIWMCYGDD